MLRIFSKENKLNLFRIFKKSIYFLYFVRFDLFIKKQSGINKNFGNSSKKKDTFIYQKFSELFNENILKKCLILDINDKQLIDKFKNDQNFLNLQILKSKTFQDIQEEQAIKKHKLKKKQSQIIKIKHDIIEFKKKKFKEYSDIPIFHMNTIDLVNDFLDSD